MTILLEIAALLLVVDDDDLGVAADGSDGALDLRLRDVRGADSGVLAIVPQ